MSLDKFQSVLLDSTGVFKYIQIRVYSFQEPKQEKVVIRGWRDCDYHADILKKFNQEELPDTENYSAECPGGGRIRHDPQKKEILIYGYSQGFGRADHALTHDMISQAYPEYKVDWNNEGY